MNRSILFTCTLLIAFIHLSGCWPQEDKSTALDRAPSPGSAAPASNPFKFRSNCFITEQDRFILTYCFSPYAWILASVDVDLAENSSRPPLYIEVADLAAATFWSNQNNNRRAICYHSNPRLLFVNPVSCADLSHWQAQDPRLDNPATDPNTECCVEAAVECDPVTLFEGSTCGRVRTRFFAVKNRFGEWFLLKWLQRDQITFHHH